ncbi:MULTISPECIES: hypothetical protein [unclassified Paenibacillus]|uniref:hypothetical protein n=1 Tax=unclassified Paenibacillus TaxID=185978 RepID=UPI00041EF89A|nr:MULTISPECIES: hypothetical protein [unclassified Paenibacillus]KGP82125.1 hypothetical protein P364_0113805 [Paenibacillus sp. MAEPY2]KGP84770.1 hypothetical protein P363_0123025 [Paenibacillus sp. MAEPY1]
MKCNNKKHFRSKDVKLKKVKGSNWTKRNEIFCEEVLESIQLQQDKLALTSNDLMMTLVLLLNSCRNSISRVKDKSKKTYFGKEHGFNNSREMAVALIEKENLLQEWFRCCELYIANDYKLEHRPTLGRIDHDLGYTLENLEVQGYSHNTSSRTRQRFSKECVAIVVLKESEKLILLKCTSGKSAIQRIDEVAGLRITKSMLKGNLTSGLRRSNKEYSVLIIGKESLMGTPEIMDLSFPVSAIHDEKHNSLIARPNDNATKVDIYIDEKDAVRLDWIDEQQTINYVNII